MFSNTIHFLLVFPYCKSYAFHWYSVFVVSIQINIFSNQSFYLLILTVSVTEWDCPWTSSAQCCPMQPQVQVQLYPLSVSVQVAPFLQGLSTHAGGLQYRYYCIKQVSSSVGYAISSQLAHRQHNDLVFKVLDSRFQSHGFMFVIVVVLCLGTRRLVSLLYQGV